MNRSRSNPSWHHDAWNRFHDYAVKYPRVPDARDKRSASRYYHRQFPQYVKCPKCRNDYMNMIREQPVRTNSRRELFDWTVDIHNNVNRKLHKPHVGYDRAAQIWHYQV